MEEGATSLGWRIDGCPRCGERVIVLLEDGQRFDAKTSKFLTPNADGLWEFVEGYMDHRCEEAGET